MLCHCKNIMIAGGDDGGGGVHGQGDYCEGLDDVCTEDVVFCIESVQGLLSGRRAGEMRIL